MTEFLVCESRLAKGLTEDEQISVKFKLHRAIAHILLARRSILTVDARQRYVDEDLVEAARVADSLKQSGRGEVRFCRRKSDEALQDVVG